jgi:hypothetical protein
LLLNSDAPVTQTTGSLATGTYVLFGNGSGTLTGAAGTATGSGFGTISTLQGNFQTITITGAGTVTITKSGTVNWFDLQNLSLPTSHISTTGTTATRNAETLSIPLSSIGIPASPTGITVLAKFITAAGTSTVSGGAQFPFSVGDGTTANNIGLNRGITTSNFNAAVQAGGTLQFNSGLYPASPANTVLRAWIAAAKDNFAAQVIGQTKITATGSMPTGLTTVGVGMHADGANQLDSTIARLVIYNSRLSDSVAAQKAGLL